MKFSSAAALSAMLGMASATPLRNHRHPSAHKRANHISKRQVPQEQSHGFVLELTREALNIDNPKGIVDPVFGLLGNAAAADGAGDVTNLDCLKQETADQAFTNAKAAGDLSGMAGALLFQAIERNSGGVGVESVLCNETAVNAEIGALTQHQDAAAEGAGALNKAITLELARQLAGIGADPNLALLSGTFAPGDPDDATGAGNSCDDEEPELGCIFSQGLLVLDATEEEIADAVADVSQSFTGTGGISATDLVDLGSFEVASVTDTVDLATIVNGAGGAGAGGAADATPAASTPAAVATSVGAGASSRAGCGGASPTASPVAASSTPAAGQATGVAGGNDGNDGADDSDDSGNTGGSDDANDEDNGNEDNGNEDNDNNEDSDNEDDAAEDDNSDNGNTGNEGDDENTGGSEANIQAFTGTLGGPPPPVESSTGDRPFSVNGNSFSGADAAISRSCDIQHNACANAANSGELDGGIEQCEEQVDECKSANNLKKRQPSLFDP